MNEKGKSIFFAIAAAVLYAVNIPFSKIFLAHIGSVFMAGFLYLGAGAGMAVYLKAAGQTDNVSVPFGKKDFPYIIGMVVLDIAAPVLLMMGLVRTSPATASLLNNFEIVATSIISFLIFREIISRKLWISIVLVTVASIILTFSGGQLTADKGALMVLGATVCWGFENNCTKMLSRCSSEKIVVIKGLCSGAGSLIIGFVAGESMPQIQWILGAMALGFVSYGLSINFYIKAQKNLGAAKTSAYYSTAPFISVIFSFIIFGRVPGVRFFIALGIMIISTIIMVRDNVELQHSHVHHHIHSHIHSHGNMVHCHPHDHAHEHWHVHEAGDETWHTHKAGELTDHNHKHDKYWN